jgi:uncharacterized protein (TIGR00369 family)
MAEKLEPIVTIGDLERFSETEFPQMHEGGRSFHIDTLEPGVIVMRLEASDRHLRPGGTVSGPTLFTFTDVTAYFVILAHIGLKALSVTTSVHLNFMRKAPPGALFCTGKIMKLGKRLAVVETSVTDGDGSIVAHGSLTYSIPPRD